MLKHETNSIFANVKPPKVEEPKKEEEKKDETMNAEGNAAAEETKPAEDAEMKNEEKQWSDLKVIYELTNDNGKI